MGISRAIILINIYGRIDIIQPLNREIRTSSSKLAIIKDLNTRTRFLSVIYVNKKNRNGKSIVLLFSFAANILFGKVLNIV